MRGSGSVSFFFFISYGFKSYACSNPTLAWERNSANDLTEKMQDCHNGQHKSTNSQKQIKGQNRKACVVCDLGLCTIPFFISEVVQIPGRESLETEPALYDFLGIDAPSLLPSLVQYFVRSVLVRLPKHKNWQATSSVFLN